MRGVQSPCQMSVAALLLAKHDRSDAATIEVLDLFQRLWSQGLPPPRRSSASRCTVLASPLPAAVAAEDVDSLVQVCRLDVSQHDAVTAARARLWDVLLLVLLHVCALDMLSSAGHAGGVVLGDVADCTGSSDLHRARYARTCEELRRLLVRHCRMQGIIGAGAKLLLVRVLDESLTEPVAAQLSLVTVFRLFNSCGCQVWILDSAYLRCRCGAGGAVAAGHPAAVGLGDAARVAAFQHANPDSRVGCKYNTCGSH